MLAGGCSGHRIHHEVWGDHGVALTEGEARRTGYRALDRERLARIHHQLPAADANALALRGRAPCGRFDVLSSTPASPSSPRAHAGRRLDALATKAGNGCGLAFSLKVLASAALLFFCPTTPGSGGPPGDRIEKLLGSVKDPGGDVIVVAHRGCWNGGAPENSLAAIARCIEIGADMLEIDVAVTRDGTPVLMHDETLQRTTAVSGRLSDFDWAAIRDVRLRAGSGGPDAALTSETIPLLRDALELCRGKILVNLDVKGAVFDAAYKVVTEVGVGDQILMKMAAAPDSPELANAAFRGKTLFMPIIRECTERNLHNNCTPRLSEYVPSYLAYDPIAYEITYSTEQFLIEGVPAITAMGSRIWINTLSPYQAAGIVDRNAIHDPAGTWGRVVELGGNIIQTDYPEMLIEFLRSQNLRSQ